MDKADKVKGENQPEEAGWEYNPGPTEVVQGAPATAPAPGIGEVVEWTASEFVAHQKGVGWYMLLGMIGLVVAAGVYLITRDVFSVVVIGTLAAVIGIAANQKPRVLTYRLDRKGLIIGQRLRPYGEFKSFSVVDEGAFASITLLPLKRFMPSVSVYVSPEDEERIIEALSRRLPLQPADHDTFDSMMRRIRF